MSAPAEPAAQTAAIAMLLGSSNPGKLHEFRALASEYSSIAAIALELLPNFSQIPEFEESAPTFAENAAGKALYYSRWAQLPLLADDSGLVVDALDGAPGVQSARYAGPNASDAQRNTKLLGELRAAGTVDRRARFVCVITLARCGRPMGIFSGSVEGEILDAPRGPDGFGYDPVFFVPALGKTFAEIPLAEKNRYSHRGNAFRKLLAFLAASPVL
jgi:XTP/dITP diphosphohydrolase